MNRRTVNTEDADREDSPDRTLAQLPGGGLLLRFMPTSQGPGLPVLTHRTETWGESGQPRQAEKQPCLQEQLTLWVQI